MDDLPTDDQLRRIEDRVMTRIRRRSQLPKQIGVTLALAGLFVGGFALVRPVGSSGGAGGGGSAGGVPAAGSAVVAARCHDSSAAGSPSVAAPMKGAPTADAAVQACVRAWADGRVPPATGETTDAKALAMKALVACRDQHKVLHVFVKDRTPATLCARNGMVAP
jgi:hypothetical protein